MVAGLIVRNYEKLRVKGGKAIKNLRKWFFHRRKEHPAATLHVFRTAEDEVDKERYNNNNNNNKNKNEQAAEYEDAEKPFFEDIIGYNDIKKLIRMSINAYEPVHILLSGSPASSKTLFMKCLMMKLQNSYFTDGGNSTKADEIARATADAVWNRIKSADIRDCVRIARMAKSIEDNGVWYARGSDKEFYSAGYGRAKDYIITTNVGPIATFSLLICPREYQ